MDVTADNLLKTGTLPKTGGAYQIIKLSADHLDAVTALHKAVHADLPDDKKSFLMSKDATTFQKHLDRGNVILGCVYEGRLIAQSLMTLPDAQHQSELLNDMIAPPRPENTAILGGMVVHPDYRGNGLQKIMLAARISLAHAIGRKDIVSSADIGNMASWQNLLRKGLEIDAIGARKDGTLRYIFYGKTEELLKEKHTHANEENTIALIECSRAAIGAQKRLLRKGYKGTGFDAGQETIKFSLKADPQALNLNSIRSPSLTV